MPVNFSILDCIIGVRELVYGRMLESPETRCGALSIVQIVSGKDFIFIYAYYMNRTQFIVIYPQLAKEDVQ